jgi:hypothetical protein
MQLTQPIGTSHPPIHIVVLDMDEAAVHMLVDKANVWIAVAKALDILVDVAAIHQGAVVPVPAWPIVRALAVQAAWAAQD